MGLQRSTVHTSRWVSVRTSLSPPAFTPTLPYSHAPPQPLRTNRHQPPYQSDWHRYNLKLKTVSQQNGSEFICVSEEEFVSVDADELFFGSS